MMTNASSYFCIETWGSRWLIFISALSSGSSHLTLSAESLKTIWWSMKRASLWPGEDAGFKNSSSVTGYSLVCLMVAPESPPPGPLEAGVHGVVSFVNRRGDNCWITWPPSDGFLLQLLFIIGPSLSSRASDLSPSTLRSLYRGVSRMSQQFASLPVTDDFSLRC